MSSKKSLNLVSRSIAGDLIRCHCRVPADKKTGISQGNAALRFMEHEFGDHLNLTNLPKKISGKTFFLRHRTQVK